MISAWADSARTDNTTTQVYGGDLYGNLWRFDINDTLGSPATMHNTLRRSRPVPIKFRPRHGNRWQFRPNWPKSTVRP